MDAWSNLKKKTIKAHHARSDIFHNLVPIGYVGRVCGLLPVKLARTKFEHASHGQTDFPLLLYGVGLTLTLTGALCLGLYRDAHDGGQNSMKLFTRTAVVVTICDTSFVIGVTCCAILGAPSRWRHVLQALDKIVQVDEKLDFATTKNLRAVSIILICCTLVYVACISTLDYVAWDIIVAVKLKGKYKDKGAINYCPLYFMYAVIVTLQMQYAIILMNLAERFTKLNDNIAELTKMNVMIDYFRKDMGLAAQEPKREISQSFVSPSQSRQRRFNKISGSIQGVIYDSDLTEPIDELIKVHDMLCDSVVHLNKAFGVQLLLCTLSCLIHLVITFYFFCSEYRGENSRWYMLMRQIGWIGFHIFKIILFVQPPHMVASRARNTGSMVSQALAVNWAPRTRKQLERFAMQLIHRPVEFTACGLFYLDRGLITSIAGAVTTYLVILVQFQNNDDADTRLLLQNATLLLENITGIKIS